MSEGDGMAVIAREELDAVAIAHRAYCQSVPGMPWTRLADGEYEAIIAAQPRGAVEENERLRGRVVTDGLNDKARVIDVHVPAGYEAVVRRAGGQ